MTLGLIMGRHYGFSQSVGSRPSKLVGKVIVFFFFFKAKIISKTPIFIVTKCKNND